MKDIFIVNIEYKDDSFKQVWSNNVKKAVNEYANVVEHHSNMNVSEVHLIKLLEDYDYELIDEKRFD